MHILHPGGGSYTATHVSHRDQAIPGQTSTLNQTHTLPSLDLHYLQPYLKPTPGPHPKMIYVIGTCFLLSKREASPHKVPLIYAPTASEYLVHTNHTTHSAVSVYGVMHPNVIFITSPSSLHPRLLGFIFPLTYEAVVAREGLTAVYKKRRQVFTINSSTVIFFLERM